MKRILKYIVAALYVLANPGTVGLIMWWLK